MSARQPLNIEDYQATLVEASNAIQKVDGLINSIGHLLC